MLFYDILRCQKDADRMGMGNSVDPDQASTLFAQNCLSGNLGSLRQIEISLALCACDMINTTNHHTGNYYSNDPKSSDRWVRANNAYPDRSNLIRVYTVCYSVCIFKTYYSMVKPQCSNFRISTAIFSGVRIFRIFMVIHSSR